MSDLQAARRITAGMDADRRIAELESQLLEARETLEAIRNGEVDAVVVGGPDSRRVYTLENADRSYRLLIEQMAEGAVMLNAEALVLYANAALAALLGVAPALVLGSHFSRFVDEADRPVLARLLVQGGTAQIGLRGPGGDGFPARLSLGLLQTDAGPVMCGVITDLTDAQQHAREISDARSQLAVEAAQREINERYRLILESATDFAILSTDVDDRVTIWSAGATNILGWTADEAVGRPAPTIRTAEDRAAGALAAEQIAACEFGRAESEGWRLRKDGSAFWASSLMMPLRGEAGEPLGFLKILRDQTDSRRAALNQQTLINELNHRVKNTLSAVQSIARQTLRNAASPLEAHEALEERLLALSRAHNVLTRESWDGAELGEIAADALAAFQDDREDRMQICGPPVRLSPSAALALSMALHELATNAVKYGALSCDTGRVRLSWTHRDPTGAGLLRLEWAERDGPRVREPQVRGFGSRLIERSLAGELGGQATINFEPTGVVCVIEAAMGETPTWQVRDFER